jgi:hypothetical protein
MKNETFFFNKTRKQDVCVLTERQTWYKRLAGKSTYTMARIKQTARKTARKQLVAIAPLRRPPGGVKKHQETDALRQIRQYQNSVEQMISKMPIQHLVRVT